MVENGSTVTVHYTGTLNDGTTFDSSRQGEPFSFQVGAGQVIPGFNNGVVGMSTGDTKNITIPSAEAYGPQNEAAVQTVAKTRFNEGFVPNAGETVHGESDEGQKFAARVVSIQDETVTLDFNHPLAGQDLNFEIELLKIAE
jgi:peptidylprolyl isomerase